jgi:hypothetical protein
LVQGPATRPHRAVGFEHFIIASPRGISSKKRIHGFVFLSSSRQLANSAKKICQRFSTRNDEKIFLRCIIKKVRPLTPASLSHLKQITNKSTKPFGRIVSIRECCQTPDFT